MDGVNPYALLAFSLHAQVVRYVVWTGLVALTCCLLVLTRTQWGQSNPLRKCIVLSLLAHLLVGIYATTVQIVSAGPRGGEGASIVLINVEGDAIEGGATPTSSADHADDATADPGLSMGPDERTAPAAADSAAASPAAQASPPIAAQVPAIESAASTPHNHSPATTKNAVPGPSAAVESAGVADRNQPPDCGQSSAQRADEAKPRKLPDPGDPIETADVPPPEAAPPAASDPAVPPRSQNEPTSGRAAAKPPAGRLSPASISNLLPVAPASDAGDGHGAGAAQDSLLNGAPDKNNSDRHVPQIYELRMARDHVRVAEQHGGSVETEAAVGAALKFLVANQSADGRWSARALGAGREIMQNGRDRGGAGSQADSGISGLCLLALLAAGHTHQQGEYAEAVRHGLEFLLRAQAADGNLAGKATLYERMYCHGMASFALSEAFAMTADERLQPAVRAAIQYTLAAQHRSTGGWRYQPGDPGDMSQFGWQAMALKSAQLGGIKIPAETLELKRRFLTSVSSGRQGGLAGYRPGHPASLAMTAEALVCRQFMGLAPDDPLAREAGDFLLKELPGQGDTNVYYWYYGTLGMYQLQGDYWRRWNTALQAELLASQRQDGKPAGSWDPDSVWGAYGGRAFSTALSTLCLEVYYRFLPLYVAHAGSRPK